MGQSLLNCACNKNKRFGTGYNYVNTSEHVTKHVYPNIEVSIQASFIPYGLPCSRGKTTLKHKISAGTHPPACIPPYRQSYQPEEILTVQTKNFLNKELLNLHFRLSHSPEF